MATGDQNEAHKLLDAYLDGLLDERARADFEHVLAEDASLRSLVALQSQIDAAIQRGHPIPDAEREISGLNGRLKPTAPPEATKNPTRRHRRLVAGLAMAAALVLAVGAAWYFTRAPIEEPMNWVTQRRTVSEAYTDMVRSGFKPLWLCKNDHQFAATFKKRFDQGLIMAKSPDVACLGISYVNSISPKTTCLLLDDRGEKSMVFVDAVDKDRHICLDDLKHVKLFRREIGKCVLYEVTPHDAPHALDLISEIEVPPEWLTEYADGTVPGAPATDKP